MAHNFALKTVTPKNKDKKSLKNLSKALSAKLNRKIKEMGWDSSKVTKFADAHCLSLGS